MSTLAYYSDNHGTTLGEYPSAAFAEARLHVMRDTYTFVAAKGASDTVELEFPRLLPGKVLVLSNLCRLAATDGDTNADLHIGYRAYTDSSKVVQVADDNFWMDNVDIGGGDKIGNWPDITGITTAGKEPVVFDAQDGLRIVVMIDTADMNIGDTVTITVVYAHID